MRLSLLINAALSCVMLPSSAVLAAKAVTVYSFEVAPDGAEPTGGLVSDAAGNLYGVTAYGGATGNGAVFELSPPSGGQTNWSETVLYSFQSGSDGSEPNGPLIFDNKGNLYGTTSTGGSAGAGTVFELTPPAGGLTSWSESVLYAFKAGTDGLNPAAGLTLGRGGVLYGTTSSGGAYGETGLFNGTVFQLTSFGGKHPTWTETILHSFNAGSADGGGLFAGLVLDKAGNLYGVTYTGGTGGSCYQDHGGCGVAFQLSPPGGGQTAWSESILYDFGSADGTALDLPGFSPLIADRSGNLYGEAGGGGAFNVGGVFKLSNPGTGQTPWSETDLASFPENSAAVGGLAFNHRNLFGASQSGDKGTCGNDSGCGYEFKFNSKNDKLSEIAAFPNGANGGENPSSGLIFDAAGNAYGMAIAGGANGKGTIFEIPAN